MLKASLLVALFTALPALAQYHDLLATEDGNTVFFQAATGINSSGWFQAQQMKGTAITGSLADINADGSLKAYADYGERYCGIIGSSCFIRPNCSASFSIAGLAREWSNTNRTLIRLNPTGDFAWISQTSGCSGIGSPPLSPTLNGIYDLRTRQLTAAVENARLTTERVGRLVITDTGSALVFTGGIQLNWLSATGLERIRHTDSAFEAVTDRSGTNIVYNETNGGTLHWIANNQDDKLSFQGSAPALTPNGKILVFLDPQGTPQAYTRASGVLQALANEPASSFTIGGNFAFIVNGQGQIIRRDLTTSNQTLWLQSSPEIRSIYASLSSTSYVKCAYVCYGPLEPGYSLSPGMFVLVQGRFLNRTGIIATLNGRDIPVSPLSDTSAWFQLPTIDPTFVDLMIIRDFQAVVSFKTTVAVDSASIACLATVHQDFARPVTAANPATVGKVVHVYATGAPIANVVPYGEPNPTDRAIPLPILPVLFDPAYSEVLFFGLAPGLIGIEQLDLRINAVPNPAAHSQAFGCDVIPVALP